jgi:uncharacterized membrane protein YphA (DoxX/SURF4 family)
MKVSFQIDLRQILRGGLALVFAWAALSKLANVQAFYVSLLTYQLPLPPVALRLIAISLPWLEFICALALVARGAWRRPATICVAALCVVFLLATGQAWFRSLNISCGCLNLGFLDRWGVPPSWSAFLVSVPFAFARAALLTVAALWLLTRPRSLSRES